MCLLCSAACPCECGEEMGPALLPPPPSAASVARPRPLDPLSLSHTDQALMVMYARKQQRLNDGCHDRKGDSQPYQALKYTSKSHPSGGGHRHDKMRDSTDPSPPNKMLRRSDSPEKYSDSTGHNKAKTIHGHRVRERDGGEF
ncbi:hypothetical protein E2320_022844, partial [Naja naja]